MSSSTSAEFAPTEHDLAPIEPAGQVAPVPVRQVARAKYDQFTHWSLLLTSSAILLLAVLMSTQGEDQVLVPIINQPLPGLCMTRRFLDVGCPGCGLTRCFISLAHG